MSVKFTIKQYILGSSDTKNVTTKAPALPRVGDYVEMELEAISGQVKEIVFWWPHGKDTAEIVVRLTGFYQGS